MTDANGTGNSLNRAAGNGASGSNGSRPTERPALGSPRPLGTAPSAASPPSRYLTPPAVGSSPSRIGATRTGAARTGAAKTNGSTNGSAHSPTAHSPTAHSSTAHSPTAGQAGQPSGTLRRPRRSSARQRIGAAIQEGRRRLPHVGGSNVSGSTVGSNVGSNIGSNAPSALEKARANRLKSKAEEASGESLRRRSQKATSKATSKVTPLAASENARSRAGAASGRTIGKAAGASIAPNLSLVRRRNSRRKSPMSKGFLVMLRLLIGGVAIAVIGGTLLKVLAKNSSTAAVADSAVTAGVNSAVDKFPMPLNQEIAPLKSALQELPNLYPNLTAKAFYIDVDTGNYVNLEGGDSMAAASTIKLPILLAFFEEVDAGRITLNQTLAILPEQIAKGSGEMQMSAPGTQFTALEVATQMIVGSDNTATNMMIDLLGGPAVLNERFKGYGLQKTQILNPLPDLKGTNTTSAKDLVHTMLLISGDRLKMHSRDRILNILNRTHNKSLLPNGLAEKEALTYNKTGDIESVLADVALVDLSNGKRYIVATLVQRPANDGRAVELIHKISARTYQEADSAVQPSVTPVGNPSAKPPAAPSAPEADAAGTARAEPTALEEEPYPSANP